MDIKYVLNFDKIKMRRNYSIMNETNEMIGSVEGSINKSGVLISVVRIYPEYQNKGLGFKAFKKVFEELNSMVPIQKIIGSWHKEEEFQDCKDGMSTNLRLFLNCLKKGENEIECAFITPTGKWAKKLGFNKCNIICNSKTSTSVEFIKNEKTEMKEATKEHY